MPPPSSPLSPLLLLLLLFLLLVLPRGGAAGGARCRGLFRSGRRDFVLDAEDAVAAGAALLAATDARSAEDCERACCEDPRCNLALLDATAEAAENGTCVTFNCVHRNRFVCRFVNRAGYQSYIRDSVYRKHLEGPGEQAPPIAIAGRDVIVQPGQAVTLSGLESLALGDAHIVTYSWSLQKGGGASIQLTEFPDQVRVSGLLPGSYVFQLSVTDSNSQSDAAAVSVTVLSANSSSMYCLSPVKVGPCRAAFPRWRYDVTTGVCESFVFGGCKPNYNNFLSEDECVSACSGVTVTSERRSTQETAEVCGPSCGSDQLTCSNGCCVLRALECDGKKHCSDGSDEDHCNTLNSTLSRLMDININQRKARCSEPPLTGPCRAALPRWYFDAPNRKCSRFTYGGCRGNGNNFEEEEKCSETCEGVTESSVFFRGMFERFEQDDDSDSGHIALAVLLSVAILALLAVLAFCVLKSRKKSSDRPASTGPAHTLPGQDTPLYHSTAKPV